MMRGRFKKAAFLLLLALSGSCAACRQTTVLATDTEIPTTTVKEANLQLKVFTTGALRTSQSRAITAPLIAGGILQIITLARSGAQAHCGHVVLEFDTSQQDYSHDQNRTDLA